MLRQEETREAEEELSELPGDDGRKYTERFTRDKNGSGSSGRGGKGGRGWGREKEKEQVVVGSSQPWVGIMRAK